MFTSRSLIFTCSSTAPFCFSGFLLDICKSDTLRRWMNFCHHGGTTDFEIKLQPVLLSKKNRIRTHILPLMALIFLGSYFLARNNTIPFSQTGGSIWSWIVQQLTGLANYCSKSWFLVAPNVQTWTTPLLNGYYLQYSPSGPSPPPVF